ncbi:hypothetical protein D3C84_471040 [compost metagenome]
MVSRAQATEGQGDQCSKQVYICGETAVDSVGEGAGTITHVDSTARSAHSLHQPFLFPVVYVKALQTVSFSSG